MINKFKLRAIERELKERAKPETLRYIRRKNGKIVVIPPGSEGAKIVLNLVMEADECVERDLNLNEICNEYPGLEPIDYTDAFLQIQEEFSEIFK